MNWRNPSVSKGQVERLARAYHRRFAPSLGASLGVDDLEQEFWIVWDRVSKRFDPEKGFAFEALLGRSIKNRAIELAKYHGRRRNVTADIPDPVQGNDQELHLIDILPSEDEPAEDRIMRQERTAHLMEEMDERLRHMVEAISNPPEILQREIDALNAKAELAKAAGQSLPRDIDLSMMTEIFNLSRCSRYRLIDQMKEVMDQYDRN